VKKKLTTA